MASRLTEWDRQVIETMRKWKHSWREIWTMLNRDHTVVMREFKRNRKRWWYYDAKTAMVKAKQRTYFKKKSCNKIRMDDILNKYILEHLEIWWSAEATAWRRNTRERLKYNDWETVCWMTIRRYIDGKYWSYIKYHMQQMKMLKKYKKKATRWKRQWGGIKNRIFINDRPKIIADKIEWWHFECDFIESIDWDKTVILVLIDKFTRLRIWFKLENKKSETVKYILISAIQQWKTKSITFDNDLSFSEHYTLGIPTYFCHTYSSREKGQVERWNRGYRIFWPKKTELKLISEEDLNKAIDRMNNYPLKCLWYMTPYEKFEEIKARDKLWIEITINWLELCNVGRRSIKAIIWGKLEQIY
jgi:transposase, IS30 family